jgi:hypothetical protein
MNSVFFQWHVFFSPSKIAIFSLFHTPILTFEKNTDKKNSNIDKNGEDERSMGRKKRIKGSRQKSPNKICEKTYKNQKKIRKQIVTPVSNFFF